MNYQTPDPIDNETSRVLVRNTVTGFEQSIAASMGLITCGPLGAIAAWSAIRGLQGKWTPWFIFGIPSVFIINGFNFILIAAILSVTSSGSNNTEDHQPQPQPQVSELPTFTQQNFEQQYQEAKYLVNNPPQPVVVPEPPILPAAEPTVTQETVSNKDLENLVAAAILYDMFN